MSKPSDDKKVEFAVVEGLKEVDPERLAEFRRAMTEEVIPEIVKIVEERRLRAVESRQWQLKC
jgi:hypothetical protein